MTREQLHATANGLTCIEPGYLVEALTAATAEEQAAAVRILARARLIREMQHDGDPVRMLARQLRAEREGLP